MWQRKRAILIIAAIILSCIGAAAQSTNASLGGTVSDSSGAVLPGVTITAENVNTGVAVTALTNEAGAYQFPSLQPGRYKLSADLPGFQTIVYNDVALQVAGQVKQNFTLSVAAVATTVEVTGSVDQLREINSTVGEVISNQKLQQLPMTDLSVLNLNSTMGGVNGNNFAGGQTTSLNISRDGISIIGERLGGTAVYTGVNIVEEVKVVVSPADAEYGRGSGQVLISTKAGTNNFHGTVFGTIRNEALNANDFFSNMRGLRRPILKREQFGVGFGGPIRRNKTFFYFLYEGQRQLAASLVTSTTLTAIARQGNFRFYPGVRNGNTLSPVPTVDQAGNPVQPAAATGPLQTFSVFGRDPARMTADTTGVVTGLLALQPLPNDFSVGDGLNSAGYTWNRTTPSNRDQYNIRIDHNFSQANRLTGSYTRESTLSNYSSVNFPIKNGRGEGMNHLWSGSLTTILSPSMVNEFRYGGKHPLTDNGPASYWYPEAKYLPKSANGEDFGVATALITPTLGGARSTGAVTHFVNGGPIYQYGDSLSINRGRHAFKVGVDLRFASTYTVDGGATGAAIASQILPVVTLGAGGVPVTGVTTAAIAGLGQNQATAQSMLLDLTGSISGIVQALNLNNPGDSTFTPYLSRIRTFHQTEASWFAKDDWKIRPDVTLNLGVRWDYYGVPWDTKGLTAGLVGGSDAIFGISGRSWTALNQPGVSGGSSMTREQLIGKNSPNADILPYRNDWNNFGPAVGLSWSIPYFGKDKSVLRMGYSIIYPRATTLGQVDSILGSTPGTNATVNFTSPTALNFGNLRLPLTTTVAPLGITPFTDRQQAQVVYDSNLRSPYIQNWNVSLQRQLSNDLTLSVRYIGSKGTKLIKGVEVNTVNIFENGILDAFRITQAGGNAPLFDRIFNGLNIGSGTIDGTSLTASQALRSSSATSAFFANNNVGAFANYLNTTTSFTGEAGGLLRRAGLPENFIVVNPQYASGGLFGNYVNSTYNSGQLELTKRFAQGSTFFANYTFGKALGAAEGSGVSQFSDPRNWSRDKRRLNFDQTHALKMNGTYELPFGPGKTVLGGESGMLSRLVEKWQIGGVMSLVSGSPLTFTTGGSTYTQGSSNAVILGEIPKGKASVTDNGVVYYTGITQAADPAIAGLTTAENLRNISTLLAIKDSSGNFSLVNPTPGTLGSGSAVVNGPRQFAFDLNIMKHVQVGERVGVEFRIDAIDVLNHPRWGSPNTNINSTSFGRITTAGGNRIVVGNLKVVF